MALTPTTELDAVNTMLSTIGESPINSLEGAAGVVDAVIAKQVLREISVQVQEEGWHFNTEKNFTLTPDALDGSITVPGNCIQCDATGSAEVPDVVVRGQRLYNKIDHTFTFEKPLKVDMVILLDFQELPQAARHYITIRAARVFQQRVIGSQTLGAFTEKDEVRARAAVVKLNTETADTNILTGSRYMYSILGR
jgi:hypothetical protein